MMIETSLVPSTDAPFPMGGRDGRASALQILGLLWGWRVGVVAERPRIKSGAARVGFAFPDLIRDLVGLVQEDVVCTA